MGNDTTNEIIMPYGFVPNVVSMYNPHREKRL